MAGGLPTKIRSPEDAQTDRSLRINMSLRGPLADFARELRRKGYVRNVPDLISQALRALQDQVTERELAKARLDTIRTSRLASRLKLNDGTSLGESESE